MLYFANPRESGMVKTPRNGEFDLPDRDVLKQRQEKSFNEDYLPAYSPSAYPSADDRAANALEYIAYQLKKMRDVMEKNQS